MKCVVLLALCCLGAALASPVYLDSDLDDLWQVYKHNHNKQYDHGDEKMRRFIWEGHLRYIRRHNLEADLGLHKFRLGMNEHGDLTDEEYTKHLKGLLPNNETTTRGATFMAAANLAMPTHVDWRDKGYVTAVKNQGACGSCWAFSSTGSLEGQYFRKTGKLVSMSEQNLVDCSTKEGNHGCRGGLMPMAFEYVHINNGIDSEISYPYEAKDGPCRFKEADVVTSDRGFVNIIRDNEEDLQKAVASVGPVSVAIDASQPTFRFYKTGVYHDSKCSATRLDHGVLAVGYGEERQQKYWLVKNSWGETWGDEGYIKMARDEDNMCGIATQASYPLI